MATSEYLNPNWCVYNNNITPYINGYYGTTWYVTEVSSGSAELADWIDVDIDTGFTAITGTVTTGMLEWVISANHIVTVYGYFFNPFESDSLLRGKRI